MPDARRSRKTLLNFTLAGLEELDHFPSDEDRQRAIGAIESGFGGGGMALGIFLTAGSFTGTAVLVRFLLTTLPVGVPPLLGDLLVFGLAGGAFYAALRGLHRRGVRRALRQQLIECGVPVCSPCGYPLRGLPPATSVCPECGRALEARVRLLLSVA